MKTKQITILTNGKQIHTTINFDQSEDKLIFLSIDINKLADKVFLGRDVFECLVKLRKECDKLGILLLCNGSRIDSYPSTMSREMSGGLLVHIYNLNTKNISEPIDIFSEAPIESIGTVEEQLLFRKKWLNKFHGL